MHVPPQFGFVIDQRKCIGCHACTTACKSENGVPLGSFRTWVKYVDKGAFPDVRRHFSVMRCNHCDDAPCVAVCPVGALHKRSDAIVDLDRDACVGCRTCMQACPYDALYLNPDKGVAEKCHYCAHRTEIGLEPACVVVCPERAIVAGDVGDEQSEIATLIREEATSRRRLEKGTKPRVWYVDANAENLNPSATTEPNAWLWSDRRIQPPPVPSDLEPPADVIRTLDVDHPPAWGWHIWGYLSTKNLAAGVMIVAPFLALFGTDGSLAPRIGPEIVAFVFLMITLALLVHDLGRPERFLKVLLTPNTRSWLVKGGWVLTAFGALVFVSGVLGFMDSPHQQLVRWLTLPVAVLTSGYSAFLFKQCRARDLWLGKALFLDLVSRATLLGFGLLLAIPGAPVSVAWSFAATAAVVVGLMLVEGRFLPKTDQAKHAHFLMTSKFDKGAVSLQLVAVSAVVALVPSLMGATQLGAIALLVAAAGILTRERAWVRAGQAVPIS